MSNRLPKPPKSYRAKPKAPLPAPDFDWARSEILPGKGEKDGKCNRTACQMPLKGQEQWFMDGNFTGGPRLYYCKRCADTFTAADIQFREPRRCQLDPTTVAA